MKKLLLTLTLLFSVSAFGGLYANDMGGGYTDSFDLSYDATKKALGYLGLSPKKSVYLKYDNNGQVTVVRVKKALRTFVAYMIEKKIYATGEELTDLDRSLGEALKSGDAAFKAWLRKFFETDFHGLKHDGRAFPQAGRVYDTWKAVFIDSGVLDESDEEDDADD